VVICGVKGSGKVFISEYVHNIDEKGRFIMPLKFREQIGNCFIITRGLDGCLFVYTSKEWEDIMQKMEQLPGNKKSTRDFKRYFLGGAVECDMDKQGRCLIPPNLRQFAEMKTEAEIIIRGMGNKIEIWDYEKWQKYETPENINPEEILEEIDFLGI
jgi:MraZ protein